MVAVILRLDLETDADHPHRGTATMAIIGSAAIAQPLTPTALRAVGGSRRRRRSPQNVRPTPRGGDLGQHRLRGHRRSAGRLQPRSLPSISMTNRAGGPREPSPTLGLRHCPTWTSRPRVSSARRTKKTCSLRVGPAHQTLDAHARAAGSRLWAGHRPLDMKAGLSPPLNRCVRRATQVPQTSMSISHP